ncbi:MAG TPA: hypothetical protein PKC28_14820 [Bdellovibrionales bacterium]|nr:hypothetical protein [Bdellovibrionales bacterium]
MRALLFVLVLFGPGVAAAKPVVCFTGLASGAAGRVDAGNVMLAGGIEPARLFDGEPMACKDVKAITDGLDATSFVLSSVGFGAACLGQVHATVFLEGGALFFQGVSLVIEQFPCQEDEQHAEALAREIVCEELQKVGITCKI